MLIYSMLCPELVTFLDAEITTREEALEALSTLLDEKKLVHDKEAFFEALLERERCVSTGIGYGVALPHAKLPGYSSFFIAIGVHKEGIHWDSIDSEPVKLIFMIGGPDDQQKLYLQILSRLTGSLKNEERRKKMLQLRDEKEIIHLFRGI